MGLLKKVVGMLFHRKLCGAKHVAFSKKITWSQLSKVGKAPAMRLTVLVPLIGIFLLFNEQTEKIFQYPQFFNEDIGVEEGSGLPSSNLYFTYFGLCFLGTASFLFGAFCPQEISGQPNHQDFVIQTTSLETPVLAKASLRSALELHFDNEFEDECLDNPEYPPELEGDFHSLMEGMYAEYDISDLEGDDDGFPEVMMSTGYLDFTELARMLWSNLRVDWPFTIPFFDIAPQFAKDIAFVRYQSLDYTKYRYRALISALYLVGFGLLIVPTAKVFIRLAYGLIVGWS